MQLSMDKLSSACNNFGLTISTKKTKVMHQPAPNRPYQEPFICVKGQKLQPVDKFMYLGSTLSRAVLIDDAINSRIAKASSGFGRLRATVWDRRGSSLATKLQVYRVVVLPSLIYACETWTVYRSHARHLNHFYMICLQKILRIKLAGQDSGYRSSLLSQPSHFVHPTDANAGQMGWPCNQDRWWAHPEAAALWWTDMWKALSRRAEKEV